MDYCEDCEKFVEAVVLFLTEDLNAYEDGEYELICPHCGGNHVTSLAEEDWREER